MTVDRWCESQFHFVAEPGNEDKFKALARSGGFSAINRMCIQKLEHSSPNGLTQHEAYFVAHTTGVLGGDLIPFGQVTITGSDIDAAIASVTRAERSRAKRDLARGFLFVHNQGS